MRMLCITAEHARSYHAAQPTPQLQTQPNSDPLLAGVMFATQSILQTAATLFASALYNSVYPPTREILPGMSFLLMAGTLVPPMIAVL